MNLNVAIGTRRACLSISDILKGLQRIVPKEKISSERHLCGRKGLVDVRGQRKMGRLVQDDGKATVTQITTHYNVVSSEHWICCQSVLLPGTHLYT